MLWGFVLHVLEYCSAVWCSAAHTHLKLLDLTVRGAQFLINWGLFEWDVAHRRSVAILCMLYNSRCNPVHPLNGALPGPYVPGGLHTVLWCHISTPMHLLAVEPRSTARLLFPSQCPSGTILLTQYSMVWDWRFQEQGQLFFYYGSMHF